MTPPECFAANLSGYLCESKAAIKMLEILSNFRITIKIILQVNKIP